MGGCSFYILPIPHAENKHGNVTEIRYLQSILFPASIYGVPFISACTIFLMTVTPELQSKFNSSFSRIMRQTSAELQKKWNGKIEWKDMKSFPTIEPEVIAELPAGAKAAYVTLLNKLSRGNI